MISSGFSSRAMASAFRFILGVPQPASPTRGGAARHRPLLAQPPLQSAQLPSAVQYGRLVRQRRVSPDRHAKFGNDRSSLPRCTDSGLSFSTENSPRQRSLPSGFIGDDLEFLLILPVKDLTGDLVMTVGEHISFHNHGFPNNALHREIVRNRFPAKLARSRLDVARPFVVPPFDRKLYLAAQNSDRPEGPALCGMQRNPLTYSCNYSMQLLDLHESGACLSCSQLPAHTDQDGNREILENIRQGQASVLVAFGLSPQSRR